MVKMYDKVRVKTNGAIGTVVDIDSFGKITVEGHKGETTIGAVYGDDFPLYYVDPADVEKVNEDVKKPSLNISKKVAVL